MIVNESPEDHDIQVEFPSGKILDARVTSRGSHTFRVKDTGEGGLKVVVDGSTRTKKNGCGYVTSINPPTILVVGEDSVTSYTVWTDVPK